MFKFLTDLFGNHPKSGDDNSRRTTEAGDGAERQANRRVTGQSHLALETLEARANPGGGLWGG